MSRMGNRLSCIGGAQDSLPETDMILGENGQN